jgi:hypothetical protein
MSTTLSGEIDMELDDTVVHLKAGDVMVQRGTIHNWVNRGTEASCSPSSSSQPSRWKLAARPSTRSAEAHVGGAPLLDNAARAYAIPRPLPYREPSGMVWGPRGGRSSPGRGIRMALMIRDTTIVTSGCRPHRAPQRLQRIVNISTWARGGRLPGLPDGPPVP